MSKSSRKGHRPPVVESPAPVAGMNAEPQPESPPESAPPEPAPIESADTPPDREPVQAIGHPNGCYIKDGSPVNANGEPISGYIAIDGVVCRIARLISHADV
jgi:hypothetical protein